MKTKPLFHLSAFLSFIGQVAVSGATHYVDLNSANPTPPFISWETAARVIQDAVDAAGDGDKVVVTNGVYATGGRPASGNALTNRVTVERAILVRSVNGPSVTVIQGWRDPSSTNGDNAVRCVYLGTGASLSGFTITNGGTRSESGIADPRGGGVWAYQAIVSNCVVVGNAAYIGGGVAYGTLYNCAIYRNTATYTGGGCYSSTLYNCTVVGNSDSYGAGGIYSGGAYNSIVYFNSANHYITTLYKSCTLPMPFSWQGSGNITNDPKLASFSRLSSSSPCLNAGSSAYAAGTDIDGEAWNFPPSIGCDEIYPGAATGPLTVNLSSTYTNVPPGYVVGLTAFIDGQATASVWDFGDGVTSSNQPFATHGWTATGDYPVVLRAYNDSHPSGVSASIIVHVLVPPVLYVAADNSNPVAPYASWATAATNIQNAVDAATVPRSLIMVSNGVYSAGGRAVSGTMTNRVAVYKTLRVQSVNGPQFTTIQGRQIPGTTNGDGAIRCVYLTNGASLSGFTLSHGATRAFYDNTYDSTYGGGILCQASGSVVSNCVFSGNAAAGFGGGANSGTFYNCSFAGNWAAYGGGAASATLSNCVLSGNFASNHGGATYYATLDNCTLTNNSTFGNGGGAAFGAQRNCLIAGNSATNGGGIYSVYSANGPAIDNCTIANNSAMYGGGIFTYDTNYVNNRLLIAKNCTITGNSASVNGGGAWGGNLTNCIVYFNQAPTNSNFSFGTLDHCCIPVVAGAGNGNITNAPLFADQAGGDFHLQSSSPCINAGLNAAAPSGNDPDGNPRIVAGTVDIGAYEFQGAGSVISYAWLQQFGLPTDGSADYADPDGDGRNNWQEWRCQTIPTNALSVLKMASALRNANDVVITWQSVSGLNYFIERSTNLGAISPFSPLATNVPGQAGTTSFSDAGAAGASPLFYRVGVGN